MKKYNPIKEKHPRRNLLIKSGLVAALFGGAFYVSTNNEKDHNTLPNLPSNPSGENVTVNNDIKDSDPVTEIIKPVGGESTLEEKVYEPCFDLNKKYEDCFKKPFTGEKVQPYGEFSKEIINGAGASNTKRMLNIVEIIEDWKELPLYETLMKSEKDEMDAYLDFFKKDPNFNNVKDQLKTAYGFGFEGETWQDFLLHCNLVDKDIDWSIENIVENSGTVIPLNDKNKDGKGNPLPLLADENGEGYTSIQIWDKYKNARLFTNMCYDARFKGENLGKYSQFVLEIAGSKNAKKHFENNKFNPATEDERNLLGKNSVDPDSLTGKIALSELRIRNLEDELDKVENVSKGVELGIKLDYMKEIFDKLLNTNYDVDLDIAKQGVNYSIGKISWPHKIGLKYQGFNAKFNDFEDL